MKKIVSIPDFESRLKRKIRKHFKSIGYTIKDHVLIPPTLSKENIRLLHKKQKEEIIYSKESFFKRIKQNTFDYFASGNEINPEKIKPRLELVEPSSPSADLFLLASLTWSVPVSVGYGRRLRFLVWDDYNNKLMGIIALKDPGIHLKVREDHIGWDNKTKNNQLIHVMDSYIVGSIPPYNQLLCGKLISCLLKSVEIKDFFNNKYKNSVGIISQKNKKPRLSLITTTSALGRSSIYNRLTINKEKFMLPVSYTDGWGHFHFSREILDDFDELLFRKKDNYYKSYKFKQGANYKIRKIRKAIQYLNMPISLLQHQIKREFFVTPIANNYKEFLNKKAKRPDYSSLRTAEEIGFMARDRWIIKRAEKDKSYKKWKKYTIKKLIFTEDHILDLPLFKIK